MGPMTYLTIIQKKLFFMNRLFTSKGGLLISLYNKQSYNIYNNLKQYNKQGTYYI